MIPGYRGDGGGLDPLFSGQAQARLNEQCRKAQATQAAVDARAARKAQEPCGEARSPAVPPEPPGIFVGDDSNFDAQGAAIAAADRAEAQALLTVAPLPDGRGKR